MALVYFLFFITFSTWHLDCDHAISESTSNTWYGTVSLGFHGKMQNLGYSFSVPVI